MCYAQLFQDVNNAALLAWHEEECTKAKARVISFGVEYKELPKLEEFLCYLEAGILRDNLVVQFITRNDTLSKDEEEKVAR